MAEKKKIIYIKGMQCVSCETILREGLSQIGGVKEVCVSCRRQTAEITYIDREPEMEKMQSVVKKLGYEAAFEPFGPGADKMTMKKWIFVVLILAGVYLAYSALKSLDVWQGWSLDSGKIGLGAAFVVGIVASLSSCLAVVGGVVISFAAKYEGEGSFFGKNIKPHLLFHAGRLISFFILGGLLGVFGGWFEFSKTFTGWLTVAVSIVIFLLGLNIVGMISPRLTQKLTMPKRALDYWDSLKASEHAAAPFVLGAFTFFLPCGFTQSMQLFAIASGNFWTGAASLLLFALGTAPVLIGLGVATSKFQNKAGGTFKKVAGVIILVFVFYTLSTGLALLGINFDWGGKKEYGATVAKKAEQEIVMTLDYRGYSPNVFTLKMGVPVKWVINAKQITGCTNEIIVPALSISTKLKIGNNVVEFTPEKLGTISFSCWMGMVRGKFIVIGDD